MHCFSDAECLKLKEGQKGAYKILYLNKKAGCSSHKAYMLAVVSFFALYLISYLDTSTLPNIPKEHVY